MLKIACGFPKIKANNIAFHLKKILYNIVFVTPFIFISPQKDVHLKIKIYFFGHYFSKYCFIFLYINWIWSKLFPNFSRAQKNQTKRNKAFFTYLFVVERILMSTQNILYLPGSGLTWTIPITVFCRENSFRNFNMTWSLKTI